jgi:hypothetical protein
MSASVLLITDYAMAGVPRLRRGLANAGVDVELIEYRTYEYDARELQDAFAKKLSDFLELHLR